MDRNVFSGKILELSAACLLAIVTTTFAAPPPNDNCSTPTAISGNGSFPFDLTQATFSGEGQDWCWGQGGGISFENDVWFCWTPPCSGMAVIQTCGQTTVDTRISWYRNCVCPTPPPSQPPFCCDDDACGLQSSINCEVECGVPVLIRLGCKPGTPPGTGNLLINCTGSACAPCDDCCGRRPEFVSRPTPGGTGFTGGVAVMTQESGILNRVLDLVDISSQPPVGTMTNWNAPFYSPTALQDWTQTNLGTVFGVTLDDLGNIYVAHTSVYGDFLNGPTDAIGTIAGGAAGAIYKIDTNTGIPSTFAVLPNAFITGCTTPPDCYPGLGNIAFSCPTKNLYVSNHEDGRIYRLDTSGNVLSTWLHATGTALAGLPPPDPNGFSPLWSHPITQRGQRVWAVRPNAGRLYYSVWREDWGRQAPGYGNEIWSVALFPNGDFVSGSEQLELAIPVWSGNYSNPVSDISFKPGSCCMLLAERTMQDDTTSYAHQSRFLEYCKTANVWTPSGVTFQSGAPAPAPPAPDSSAGGCDYDFATGAGVNVNVWVTSDYMKYPPLLPFGNEVIYGLGGMQYTGTNPYTNGIMIDSNQFTGAHDKFLQGDVEITCSIPDPLPCGLNPATGQCENACTTPGTICAPVEVVRTIDGHYQITRCDCGQDGLCRMVYNGPDLPPICVDSCPAPSTGMCAPRTRTNLDGTTTYTCGCEDPAPECAPISYCNPDQPGSCLPACAGPCPDGTPCVPSVIYEYPAGSGHFSILQCDCTDSPCHPVIQNNRVVCSGACPGAEGGLCNVVAIPDTPNPSQPEIGVTYRCGCECKNPPQNMVDWWPMNSTTPVRDRANLLNHGTPSGGVTAGTGCVVQGLTFNGTNGVVSVPNAIATADINFGLGDFTLEGWVKTTVQGYQPMLDKRAGGFPNVAGYAFFLWTGGNIGFQMGSPPFANFFTSGFNVQDGQCHHVAAVVKRGSPNQIRLYVDGVFQSFTNSSVTGSVNNAANLLFGREYVFSGGGTPLHFNGVLDEWEFFRRALTHQEILDLYNARNYGKCCDVCYTPPVVFCRNQTTKQLCFQVCNYCDEPATYKWSLAGPIGGAGCSTTGPITFTPAHGVTPVLKPGECRTICVTVSLPSGMPIPPPIVTACYQLSFSNMTTGRQFSCTNTITRSRSLCIECFPPCAEPVVVVGTTRDFTMMVTNEANPTGDVPYQWTVRYPNSNNAPDAQAVSLNGLPPGEPVFGTLLVAPGTSTPVPISVTVLQSEPFQPIEIVLEADTDGDGVPDPVDRIPIRAVECAVAAGGDMNEDGQTTTDDITAFVQAVVGSPIEAYDVLLADVNCDAHANGVDIQPFVTLLLSSGP